MSITNRGANTSNFSRIGAAGFSPRTALRNPPRDFVLITQGRGFKSFPRNQNSFLVNNFQESKEQQKEPATKLLDLRRF